MLDQAKFEFIKEKLEKLILSTFLVVGGRIINKLKNLRRKLNVYFYNFRNLF